jgi:hypothetical protein
MMHFLVKYNIYNLQIRSLLLVLLLTLSVHTHFLCDVVYRPKNILKKQGYLRQKVPIHDY